MQFFPSPKPKTKPKQKPSLDPTTPLTTILTVTSSSPILSQIFLSQNFTPTTPLALLAHVTNGLGLHIAKLSGQFSGLILLDLINKN